MTAADLDSVLAIERLCFTHPFNRALFESELKQEAARILVAEIDKKITGYVDFWTVLDEIHVVNLAVHPNTQRQGIASRLFEEMIDTYYQMVSGPVTPSSPTVLSTSARGGGPPSGVPPLTSECNRDIRIYLEVREQNEPARRFYEKWGFRVLGRRKGYYQNGEDALVMVRKSDDPSTGSGCP